MRYSLTQQTWVSTTHLGFPLYGVGLPRQLLQQGRLPSELLQLALHIPVQCSSVVRY